MIEFHPAKPEDIAAIVSLVNQTYRGEQSRLGWTTEADLLDGLRTDQAHMASLVNAQDSRVLLAKQGDKLLGSILLEYLADSEAVELGMFAVAPSLQNRGIGKQLLAYAESFALNQWRPQRLILEVIPCRQELISFYQRRGYQFNGASQPFPVNPELWRPKREGLTLACMEKRID
jgi:ribosomal protein S18 acetylase RimI-like enzyme